LKYYRTYLADASGRINTYNGNTCEQLADQFAARHGAGRELVTGLARLYDNYGVDIRMSHKVQFVADLVGSSLYAGAILVMLGVAPPIGLLFTALMAFVVFTAEPDNTYDQMKDRCVRVRNDMMEQIKKRELDKNELKILTDKVQFMDDFIHGMSSYQTLFIRFLNIVRPLWAENKRQYDLARELETLVSNDLFLASAKLRTL
jgi:hypothetical protein